MSPLLGKRTFDQKISFFSSILSYLRQTVNFPIFNILNKIVILIFDFFLIGNAKRMSHLLEKRTFEQKIIIFFS